MATGAAATFHTLFRAAFETALDDIAAECAANARMWERARRGGNAAETLESWRRFNARYAAHMAAEDDVLFPAVASRIENVAYAYEFEHEAEEWLFEEVTACLEASASADEANDDAKRREFGAKAARIVHATRTTLKAHLAKESEHVLPMLEAEFGSDEQAA